MVLRLIRPTSGEILFEGRDISGSLGRENCWPCGGECKQFSRTRPLRSIRASRSPEPSSAAPLEVHSVGTRGSAYQDGRGNSRACRPFFDLCITSPTSAFGGTASARRDRSSDHPAALLDCSDEPTSALDVSVQAQILALLQKINREFGLACVFVSYNLGVIRVIADDVAVMRRGKVIEAGPVERVFENPREEYTRALIDAVPDPSRRRAPVLSFQSVAEE